MNKYQEVEHAIAVLETQRSLLGDDIVDLSLSALRDKLLTLQTAEIQQQQSNLTILIGDISGFTKMSEVRDAELVRETINAVWKRLDGVIHSWGGRVDKHIGDAVIALFGVPVTRDDDTERAIQAALDMQMELTLINEQMRQHTGKTHFLFAAPRPELGMRIAIHHGPVYFGKLGTSDETTAVGEAVNVVNQMEKLAPVDGLLISEDVYERVHTLFEVERREPVLLEGKSVPTHLYQVLREKTRPFHTSIRGIGGVETRIVGRTTELQTMQDTLQATIDSGTLQVITIEGESGIGKSRLLYEFERLIGLLPEQIELFRGRVHQEIGQKAYALFRDLLANYFDIHHRNSSQIAREKFVRGIVHGLDDERGAEPAHYIGKLMGFDFADSPYINAEVDTSRQLRETAFQELVRFFTAVAFQNSAVVLFLEDIHWADEGSFDLIDYLVQECVNVPILLVCLARPTLFDKRPSWAIIESLNPTIYNRIPLPILSSIDSRHLAMEILRNAKHLPNRLIDMIVTGAQGNPFFLEELIAMLIEWEVITPDESGWQINMLDVPNIHDPLSVADLVEKRLEHLPALERRVLEKAAVLGHIFWDSVLIHLIQAEDSQVSSHDIIETLYRLEKEAWIYRRQLSTIGDMQEFGFRHDSLQESIYKMLPGDRRQTDHRHAAEWFTRRTNRHGRPFTPVIANHFEQANRPGFAANWYHRAAEYARDVYMPETAISYFSTALTLLPYTSDSVPVRILLNEGVADMLRGQSRFQEAMEAYQQMISTAESASDTEAQMRGLRALLLLLSLRGEASRVMQTAVRLRDVATDNGQVVYQAISLAGVAWSHLLMGNIESAVPVARQALELCQSDESGQPALPFCEAVLANVARLTQHPKEAGQLMRRALSRFQTARQRQWEALLLANLAHLADSEGNGELARTLYQDSMQIARNIGDYFTGMLSLRKLGLLAQAAGEYETAELCFHQALVMAERSNQRRFQAMFSNALGQLYLEMIDSADSIIYLDVDSYFEQTYIWLHKSIQTSNQMDYPLVLAEGLAILADLQLMEGNETAAKKSIERARAALARDEAARPERISRRQQETVKRELDALLEQINVLPPKIESS